MNITRNGTDMCLTCVYQQSSNTGCIVLVISPLLSTILLDVTIERCLSPSVNGTYILYGYDKRDNGERSLKYALVKEFVVDWSISENQIVSSSPLTGITYISSVDETSNTGANLCMSNTLTIVSQS